MTNLTYCRYCVFCIKVDRKTDDNIVLDPFVCRRTSKILTETMIKKQTKCDIYLESAGGDIISGRKYTPRHQEPSPMQISMFSEESL